MLFALLTKVADSRVGFVAGCGTMSYVRILTGTSVVSIQYCGYGYSILQLCVDNDTAFVIRNI